MAAALSYPTNGVERLKGRRKRATLSCLPCHQSKIKCDRQVPCQSCVIFGRALQCSYQRFSASGNRITDAYENPSSRVSGESVRAIIARSRVREIERGIQASRIMGGTIPYCQASAGALGQFVQRFNQPYEVRSYVELLADEGERASASPLLKNAFQTVYITMCGKDTETPEIQLRGLKLYGATIKQLQTYLNGENATKAFVLYSTMLMAIHETIVFSEFMDRNSIYAHLRGISRLFQWRGPHRHVQGLEHEAFRRYRIQMILIHMIDRKSSFLAEEQWKRIPFSGSDGSKNINDKFQDILAEIPGVLEMVDALVYAQSSTTIWRIQKAYELAQLIRKLIFAIERWKFDWILTYPSILMHLHTTNPSLVTLNNICSQLENYDHLLEQSLNCYCTTHLILAGISHRMSQKSVIMGLFLRPPYQIQELVDAIIRISIRQLYSNALSLPSIVILTFSLRVALMSGEVNEPYRSEELQTLLGQASSLYKSRFNIGFTHPTVIVSPLEWWRQRYLS